MEFTEDGKQFDDGDYFQFNKDGTVKLRDGKAKIDLSKMSKDDLRKLGIDTKYMTKEQIAKKLKVRHDVITWCAFSGVSVVVVAGEVRAGCGGGGR